MVPDRQVTGRPISQLKYHILHNLYLANSSNPRSVEHADILSKSMYRSLAGADNRAVQRILLEFETCFIMFVRLCMRVYLRL